MRWSEHPISIGDLSAYLVWFDSLGAKSSCVLIETPDVGILIDPGVAAMQPSYPLPTHEKLRLKEEAFIAIREAAKRADIVVISHYHYDHHTLPSKAFDIYEGKELWIKDPNKWINGSQWDRARLFLGELYEAVTGGKLDDLLVEPEECEFEDPLRRLPLAVSRDYGDYQARKEELLRKGKAWFEKMAEKWATGPWISEFEAGGVTVNFADGKSFSVGRTHLEFTEPLFHGVEYDRVGWVFATKVECGGVKVIHASDLQGPVIEDYAEWLARESPNILILDGPPTYLFPYMFNKINLERAVENMRLIIRRADCGIIIYDHHLTRDRLFAERVGGVYSAAAETRKKVITAAEWFGRKPLILEAAGR